MDLLKKRNFGSIINDTFSFFRAHGKSYFKHYFTINGILLIFLVALIFITFKYYFEALFANIGNGNTQNLDAYINNNAGLFLTIAGVFLIFISILTLIGITLPIIYFKKIQSKDEHLLTTKTFWHEIMQCKLKMFVFLLSLLVLATPFFLLFVLMAEMPNFFLLWLPFYIIVTPAYISWIYQSYYFYIIEGTSILESYSLGFANLKSQFWAIVGSTVIMFIIIQVAQVILSIIPYMIMIFNIFVNPNPGESGNQEETYSMLGIGMSIIFVLFILSTYVLNNLIIINQGIIFYSCKDSRENLSTNDLIDSIGKSDL